MALTTTAAWTGTDEQPATNANTGYLPGLSLTDTGATAVWKSDWQPRGENSILVTGTSSPGYAMAVHDIAATDLLAFDQPIRPVSLPASEQAYLFMGAGETRNFSVNVVTSGAIVARPVSGGNWSSAAGVMAAGVPVIMSVHVSRHASAGTFRVVIYEEDGVTVRADSGTLTARGTGSAAITRTRSLSVKSSSSSTVVSAARFGRPRWDAEATGLLPAWVAPVAARPVRMKVGGVYVPADMRMKVGTSFVPII